MDYNITNNYQDLDKQIFPKLEHNDNIESSINKNNLTPNTHPNGSSYSHQKQQLISGQGNQYFNSNSKGNGFTQYSNTLNNTQDTANTNNQQQNTQSSTITNSLLSNKMSGNKNDPTDILFKNYDSQHYNPENQQKNGAHVNPSNDGEDQNIPNDNSAGQGQKQSQAGKASNLAIYELQPEIKGMIVALKYIGVPNNKVVEEISKLGFTISDSNVFMVWDDWVQQRGQQGKSVVRESNQAIKIRGSYKKNKHNRKFSGRQSSDDEGDQSIESCEDSEQEVYYNKYRQNKHQQNPRDYRQQGNDTMNSDEFDEHIAPIKYGKYAQPIYQRNNVQGRERFNEVQQRRNKDQMMNVVSDFDSDYDENYKKKANDSRKQVITNYEKQMKKKIKQQGDHIIFFNFFSGQCVYCAQNNKQNEVFSSCINCEGNGKNKFFICEECFAQNHAKPTSENSKPSNLMIKDEDNEELFMDSDTSSDGIVIKKVRNTEQEDIVSEKEKNKNQLNNHKETNNENLTQKNDDANQPLRKQEQHQEIDTLSDLAKKSENEQLQSQDANQDPYGLSLMERISKGKLLTGSQDTLPQPDQTNSTNHSNQMNNQLQGQKKILKIYKNNLTGI